MTKIVLTYDDFAALPNDGPRYELHDGELSVTPTPSLAHQEILLNLAMLLSAHVRRLNVGKVFVAPVDCILTETTVVQPDLLYLDTQRLSLASPRGVEGSPALAVEILSPSTVDVDRRAKLQLYARHRVPHYWIVDPSTRVIDAHRLGPEGYDVVARLHGAEPTALPPFPDLILDPAAIWPSP